MQLPKESTMATQQKARNLETFVKQQLEGAQRRIKGLEGEAEKFFGQINPDTLLGNPKVKELGRKATQVRSELRKRLDGFQTRAVEAVGVASQAQLKELNRELSRLSKKLDQLVPAGAKKAASRAVSRFSTP
jgi:hypothetical protein